jgi:hypothetical protein
MTSCPTSMSLTDLGDPQELPLRPGGRGLSSRLVEPCAVARVAHSIERCGQIVPCNVVAAPGGGGGELEQTGADRRISAHRRSASPRRRAVGLSPESPNPFRASGESPMEVAFELA